ncbi:MAG: TolC family protein [Gammaproteobacteria bacterium]
MKMQPSSLLLVSATLLLAVVLTTTAPVFAQSSVVVAVVTDGPLHQLQDVQEVFQQELELLVGDEFHLEFRPLVAEWSRQSAVQALDTAYSDSSVDMVLVLGIAANQITVSRADFPKPTFLPLVFNPDIVGAPVAESGSGKSNLNYLADLIPVDQDIASFRRVSPFSNAVLVSDSLIVKSIPNGPTVLQNAAEDVTFSFVLHDGVNHNLIDLIPNDTQAVLLGGLPRLPAELFDQFLDDMADRGLLSFSLVSEAEVKRGALASYTTLTDFRILARRNALNMQAVMLGERAEEQPISFEGKRQLTINMKTAQKIGLSPRFDVLSEAEIVETAEQSVGPALSLKRVAELALVQNLDLAASRVDVDIGLQDLRSAKANLLPQLSITGSTTRRRGSDILRGPISTEQSTSGALTLSQVVYSDAILSGYQQQKFLQQGREAGYAGAQLDRVLEATTAFLQALRADNQLSIQQDNLKLSKANLNLAQDRVRIGSASNADVYRWEANLAAARSNVLAARAQSKQAREAVSRLLNQPLDQPLKLEVPKKDDPFFISAEEFDSLIDNPRRFGWFVEYSMQNGVESSPELRQLRLQIDAVERDIVSKRREFWLPQVNVQAQYLDNIAASGVGAGSSIDSIEDWNVSLNASIPIFAGNSRKAALDRSRLQRRQLKLVQNATAERVKQSIRASLYSAQSSYINIELSEIGAEAARRNLELVSESYKQGTLSILDLLDAQNQSLQADLNANNAVHNFLLDIMNLQRATNRFDFLASREEQTQAEQELIDYIELRESQRNGSIGDTP